MHTERKWRSDFFLNSRSLAPFPPGDRSRYLPENALLRPSPKWN